MFAPFSGRLSAGQSLTSGFNPVDHPVTAHGVYDRLVAGGARP